jgi:hypothetical protein
MSSSSQQSEAVSQATILAWMAEVHARARSAPWFELVDFDGIDAIDVLLSPIYLSVLSAVRAGLNKAAPSAEGFIRKARNWAYRAKAAYGERTAARRCAPPGPTDILFWSRDITHTNIMRPVVAAIGEQGGHCRIMACQPKVLEMLRSVAPDPVYTMGAWPKVVRQARREGTRRAQALARIGAWTQGTASDGSTPREIEAVIRAAVIEFLPLASESIANARAALDALRPKVMVVGNDLTTEGRAGCRVAATRGVASAMFTHGSVNGDALQRLHCADRVLVDGKRQFQVLAQQGIAEQRLIVCGAPNLDRLPPQTGRPHPLLVPHLASQPGDPWILVATSGPGNRISYKHHTVVIEQLERLSLALGDTPVVVKLHRKDRLEHYQRALRNCAESNLIVVPDDAPGVPRSIFDWLQGCSVVLTGASAVAVEAMLMHVPVITMDFCEEIRDVDFIDAGATVHVRSGGDLLEQVRGILSNGGLPSAIKPRVHAYLEEAYCALDGRSAHRGALALRAMAQAATSPGQPEQLGDPEAATRI